MDLIGSLASTLGVEEGQAQALAGGVMGLVKDQVGGEEGEETAQQLEAAVPEMGGWQAKAAELAGGGGGGLMDSLTGGGGGGLLGSLAGAVGGEQAQGTVAVVGLLQKFNIDSSKAALVAPLILNFLKDRLSPEMMGMVMKAAPMLMGGGEEGTDEEGGLGGVVSGALGGLFGKD